jgi:hypothetical protein
MSKIPQDVIAFMEAYSVASDELWEVRPGTYAIKHKALERVAAEQNVTFEPPTMLEFHAAEKIAVLCVTGRMAERVEWSIGEAAPYNNKNTYPFAMAEKRAKDRVTLKLLNAHGALYSEAEADEFKENGSGIVKHTTLPKKDAREVYAKMQREVQECATRDHLKEWMKGNAERIKVLPEDWQDILRLQCEEMLADLRQREQVPA